MYKKNKRLYCKKINIMNQKEKAKELVDKFYNVDIISADMMSSCNIDAKQCALISVNEIIELDVWNCFNKEMLEYWQEVKNEIENL